MGEVFPLNRLSPELVGEVFQRCLPERARFSATEAPLVLTRVCSLWRAIALATPCLWSHIRVPSLQQPPCDVVALVRLWLERSGQTKLSVDIEISILNSHIEHFNVNNQALVVYSNEEVARVRQLTYEILSTLLPHHQRIRHVRTVFPIELIPLICINDTINARSIFLHGIFTYSIASDAVVDIGPPRDSLKVLGLYRLPVNTGVILQHKQLTHLELFDLRPSGALCQKMAFALLQHLPNLKTAVFDMTLLDQPSLVPPQERIVIEGLQTLFIKWTFPADVTALLDSICTPNLERLCLRGTPLASIERPWPSLSQYLKASGAPIRRVSFGEFGNMDFQLLECLKQCKDAERITLLHCVVDDVVFEELAQKDSQITLVPELRKFTMGVCKGFKADSFLGFVRSRSEGADARMAKLEDLNVYYCTNVTEDDRIALMACGVKNIVLETVDATFASPFARILETHDEFVAL